MTTTGDAHLAARLVPRQEDHAALDRLAGLAARLLSASGSPVSCQVSLLTDVQVIAAGHGLADGAVGSRSALEDSLCTVTAAGGVPLIVSRASEDDRVSQLPPVTSRQVGAYLGIPLEGPDRAVVGALCVFGPQPRTWTDDEVGLLQGLAGAVMAQLELQALQGDFDVSRQRWEVAIAAAGIGTFDWDLTTDRLDWDEPMKGLFGFPLDEAPSQVDDAFARVHSGDRASLDEAIATAVLASGDFAADFRVIWPSGEVRWLSTRGRALTTGGEQAGRLIGTAHDITEVRTVRDDAARLLENMATGFLSVDGDWRVNYLNLAGSRVVGYTPEQLVGQLLWDAFPGLERAEFGQQYLAARTTGEIVEFEAYYDHLQQWFEVRAVPDAYGLALYFLDITARRADQAGAEAANQRLALLAQVSEALANAGLAIEDAVAQLAVTVVPLLADWTIVTLLDGERLRDVGSWHRIEQLRPVLEHYSAVRLVDRADLGAVQQVRDTGRAVVRESGVLADVLPTLGTDDAREALTALGVESMVVVPLQARGQLTGVLTLARLPGRPPMSTAEISIALEVAGRAGLALDNARLYAEQRSLAEGLQRSLLTVPPEPDHAEIVVRYAPAAEVASVGGDWFDSFLQLDGATVLVIGDVMGHDTVAAAAMGQVRSLLRGIAWHSGGSPAEVLTGLDAAMQGLQVGTTATAVVARLEQTVDERDRGITRLRWSNAGHPPPMVIQPDGSVLPLVGVEADLLLGIDPNTSRTETVVAVDRGSTVLLYTDGLVERRGQDLDEGMTLLATTLADLADLPLEQLCDELLARMLPSTAEDDVALVAVRLHRQDQPRPAGIAPRRLPPEVPPEPS